MYYGETLTTLEWSRLKSCLSILLIQKKTFRSRGFGGERRTGIAAIFLGAVFVGQVLLKYLCVLSWSHCSLSNYSFNWVRRGKIYPSFSLFLLFQQNWCPVGWFRLPVYPSSLPWVNFKHPGLLLIPVILFPSYSGKECLFFQLSKVPHFGVTCYQNNVASLSLTDAVISPNLWNFFCCVLWNTEDLI